MNPFARHGVPEATNRSENLYGKKHPMDEGSYKVVAPLGRPDGRASATREELRWARANFQKTIRRYRDEPDVDVERAWEALKADDIRLGRV